VVVEILDVKGLVEVEGLAETFHEFRRKSRIERVYLARLSGRKIDDEKRNDGNEKESDSLLDDASADKGKHKKGLKCAKVKELNKDQKTPLSVIPAEAGIQFFLFPLDSRLRGSDDLGDSLRTHQSL
jgi:hypothetical protein